MAKKPSMGRQKIKIAKIQIKNHLQVTFSKRRSGLFKKASELCTLCGVEVAIVVFSPAGKVFSFGHPNVDSIVDQFLKRSTAPQSNSSTTRDLVEAHRVASLRELNLMLTQVLNELESEKRHGETLDHMRKLAKHGGEYLNWWEAPVEGLGLNELEQLRDSMEELKRSVTNQGKSILADATATYPSPVFSFNDQYPCERKLNLTQINGSATTANNLISFGYGRGCF